MIFSCLLLAHVLGGLQTDVQEIQVLHVRPSKMAAELKDLLAPDADNGVTVTADDSRGVILLRGDASDVRQVRSYANLFDVQRRHLSFHLRINSKIDKESYDVSARVLSNQMWRTSDADLGVAINVSPRINDDNTVTFYVEYGTNKSKISRTTFRLKAGGQTTLSIGNHAVKTYIPVGDRVYKESLASIPDPEITVKLDEKWWDAGE